MHQLVSPCSSTVRSLQHSVHLELSVDLYTRHYKVTPSLNSWAQAYNQSCTYIRQCTRLSLVRVMGFRMFGIKALPKTSLIVHCTLRRTIQWNFNYNTEFWIYHLHNICISLGLGLIIGCLQCSSSAHDMAIRNAVWYIGFILISSTYERTPFCLACFDRKSIVIPPLNEVEGGYTGFTLSVCPSVSRIVCTLYILQYSPDAFHNFIFTHLIKQLQWVCRV